MSRTPELQPLSKAEWETMKVLWTHGDMALGEVMEHLPSGQNWAYNTVKTFMRRMVEKGWVTTRNVGGSFLYKPAVKKHNAVGCAVKEFSLRVLDGVMTPFVAYYAKEKGLSDKEIADLEKIISDSKRRKGGVQ